MRLLSLFISLVILSCAPKTPKIYVYKRIATNEDHKSTSYKSTPIVEKRDSKGFTSKFPKPEHRTNMSFEITGKVKRKCVTPYPNYYFLGVVVYDYDSIPDLDYVKNDKRLIYELASCYLGVPIEHIKILENPTYAKLKRELKAFAKNIRNRNSNLYFYYSGHGVLDSKGIFYILPADASIDSEEILKESGINIDELKNLLAGARGKKIAFIDACRINPPWKPAIVVYRPKLTDLAFIFSTREGQISNIDKEKKYSAFTRALYEMASSGLINLDFDGDGYIEIKEIERPLTNWARKVSADSDQTPEFWGPKDFEIFPVE